MLGESQNIVMKVTDSPPDEQISWSFQFGGLDVSFSEHTCIVHDMYSET